MRIVHCLAAAIVLSGAVSAGEVYKCKGPNGEVTFTNIKCPEKSQVQHYGSYTPAPDDPVQGAQAAAAVEVIHVREAQAAATAAAAAAPQIVDPFATPQRSAIAAAPAVVQREDIPPAEPMRRQAEITDCHSGGASVTCWNDDGSAVTGSKNGTVWDDSGNATQLNRDAAGALRTDNGVCVKDAFGNCI